MQVGASPSVEDILFNIEEHDVHRRRLAERVHEATSRVRDTNAVLKVFNHTRRRSGGVGAEKHSCPSCCSCYASQSQNNAQISLEPLTFAFGEEDGQAYYEAIINAPEAYQDDKRPAFQQVRTSLLSQTIPCHTSPHRSPALPPRTMKPFTPRATLSERLRSTTIGPCRHTCSARWATPPPPPTPCALDRCD
jgi:hypothetical protein